MADLANYPLLLLILAALLGAGAALLFWPGRGVVPRWRRSRAMNDRIYREDALKHIHKLEMKGQPPTLQSIAGALGVGLNETAALIGEMEAAGLLRDKGGTPHLTPEGRAAALHIIRAHRLWEHYLAEETGYREADWHTLAEQQEHGLSADDLTQLASRLGNPIYDPHGDPIPAPGGELIPHGGEPLATLALDRPARIVHLEDEPETVYAQLVAEGLAPGMVVRVTAVTPKRVRFWANGDEHVLAPVVAANVFVRPEPVIEQAVAMEGQPLCGLALGESAEVVALSPGLRGQERRRLLDLGLLPGTQVTAELRSPSGDPTAYRVRGAVIALREEQARLVRVKPVTNE
jgi:DtxR family Mn-dependent transcriptional regulator